MTERKIFASDEDFIICNISDVDRSDYVELHRQLNGEAVINSYGHRLYNNNQCNEIDVFKDRICTG